ncbi:MAG: MerR family transcriptional regulator [Tepidanaerobacteraceae bacterium]
MKLRNCPICGKLFVYTYNNKCPDCAKKYEEDFKKVRAYLAENPNTSIEEIAEKTGVNEKRVLEFLREGRLILKRANRNLITCELCDKPIFSGKYCEECAAKVKAKFNTISDKPLKKSNDMSGKIHLSKYQKDKR